MVDGSSWIKGLESHCLYFRGNGARSLTEDLHEERDTIRDIPTARLARVEYTLQPFIAIASLKCCGSKVYTRIVLRKTTAGNLKRD